MKIARVERLIDDGEFSRSEEWAIINGHIRRAIEAVEWPKGSGRFILFDEPGKGRGRGNGVKPIKEACMRCLKSLGWSTEARIDLPAPAKLGRFDACYPVGGKRFCVEWETGNISSSHRAVNKMALGILHGVLAGGLLILPTRSMYRYLTDRVGNFEELAPYFPLWKALSSRSGFLAVIAVEHDGTSREVPRIPKGTDGRALQ